MPHTSLRWLYLLLLATSLAACARGSYVAAVAGTAAVTISLDSLSAPLPVRRAARRAQPEVAALPLALAARPRPGSGRPRRRVGRPRRAASTSTSMHNNLIANPNSHFTRRATAPQQPTSTAAKADPLAIIALVYIVLILTGLVFLVRFLVRLVARQVRRQKATP